MLANKYNVRPVKNMLVGRKKAFLTDNCEIDDCVSGWCLGEIDPTPILARV